MWMHRHLMMGHFLMNFSIMMWQVLIVNGVSVRLMMAAIILLMLLYHRSQAINAQEVFDWVQRCILMMLLLVMKNWLFVMLILLMIANRWLVVMFDWVIIMILMMMVIMANNDRR